MKISEITAYLDSNEIEYEFEGNLNDSIIGFSSIKDYREDSMTWVRDSKTFDESCRIAVKLLISPNRIKLYDVKNVIYTEDPKACFFSILSEFWGNKKRRAGIERDSYVSEEAVVDETAYVGHGCVLDGKISIGKNTVIESHVVIMNHVKIGDNCMIHSGAVIGKDGFGFTIDKDSPPQKVEHFGGVTIGNHVELGAHVTVDRGVMDDTCIGDNTKIDSKSVIGHNCKVGSNNLIIGASLGGSCVIGNGCYLAPYSYIKNLVTVGSECFVGPTVYVSNNLGDYECMLPGQKKIIRLKNYRRFL